MLLWYHPSVYEIAIQEACQQPSNTMENAQLLVKNRAFILYKNHS